MTAHRTKRLASIPRAVCAALALQLALFSGCGSNDGTGVRSGRRLERDEFQIEIVGLGDPSPAHYEAWFVVDGVARSGGRFRVDAAGELLDLSGAAVPGGVLRAPSGLDISAASEIFVSIEPDDDSDPAPSASRVLGGLVSGGTAALSTGSARALGVAFAGASGIYFLETPTTEPAYDFNRGLVWAVLGDNPPATLAPGLSLPALPANGWVYEAWVTDSTESGVISYSTGRFTSASGFDSDRAGQAAGPFGADEDGDGRGDGVPFPAQDFVDSAGNVPPLVLDDGGFGTFVSVEPEPDNAAAPFFIRPIEGAIPGGTSQVTLDLDGLGPVGAGHFEAWARVEGAGNVSIGKFRVDDTGALRDLSGNSIDAFDVAGDLFLASRIFVTVEAEGDADVSPSRSKILEGVLVDSSATLSADSILSNRASFSEARFVGTYMLNAFTTEDSSDFGSGIWFFHPSRSENDADSASLRLPTLRDGWQFEGWVERLSTGDTYSTGRFFDPNAADLDRAGLTAGTFGEDLNLDGRADGPRYPGQDFVDATATVPAPLDLDGGDFRAFVTVEPFPDSDPAPFLIRFFEDGAIDSLGALERQPLERGAAPIPSGTARVSRGAVERAMTNRADRLPTGTVRIGG
jgi:hypothetical protein